MKYMLICDRCGQKHFTDGDTKDLVEVKSAPLPRRAIGKLVGAEKEDFYQLPKRFKCYNCGYLFRTTNLPVPEKKEEVKQEKFDMCSEEDYLKTWERESLKSARKKP
jgi:hypothetical protein